MKRIAQFFKVNQEQFCQALTEEFPQYTTEEAREIYRTLELPKRATRGSAGYDFYAPVSFSLKPGATVKIPTGIRVHMAEGWVLQIFPRSGLGFKY
ncbi:MAG: deoxyuridine 5'-triphosphate nucleotidohydrolase, partial [Acetatifactor sp.]|nr:deoxyuridine 5'-triphosphate nucleotidohydrolase [Acetatifactor sp.]